MTAKLGIAVIEFASLPLTGCGTVTNGMTAGAFAPAPEGTYDSACRRWSQLGATTELLLGVVGVGLGAYSDSTAAGR